MHKFHIDRFGGKIRVNSSNFNVTILKFSEKFDHQFPHVFIFANVCPETHGFVAMPVTRFMKDTCYNVCPYLISEGQETKLFDVVTGTAMKPLFS